ncbi:MAG: hypothetical protein AABY40_04515 [Nanoarchaeota archaeon]
MKRQGQVTIFVIAGIIILTLIGAILAFRTTIIKEEIKQEEVAPLLSTSIQEYVESCIQKSGEEALLFVAQHGGYYQLPELAEQELLLPYYFYGNKSHVVSREELEKQISRYMDDNLFFCIRNFAPFRKAGYEIKQEEVSTSITVLPERVVFDVTFPITVTQDALSKQLLFFSRNVQSRIGTMREVVTDFMAEQEKDATALCVSCLVNPAIEADMRTEITPVRNDTIKIILIDEKIPYEFIFLNQYYVG